MDLSQVEIAVPVSDSSNASLVLVPWWEDEEFGVPRKLRSKVSLIMIPYSIVLLLLC